VALQPNDGGVSDTRASVDVLRGGYMGKKRRELVMRVGYDAKNAAHLIRLLRMGIEFSPKDRCTSNAPTVLSCFRSTRRVAAGKSKSRGERLFNWRKRLRPFISPTEPDRDRAEKLCVKMIAEYHGLSVG